MAAICPRLLSSCEALWIGTTRLGSFGSALGLILSRDGGKLTPKQIDATTTEWTCPYPAWAARPDGKLCLATALALADEISSYGGMACWDDRHRPGITISIAATLVGHRNLVPEVAPGEELTFVSRRLKTGRQLGYMELEVWRGSASSASSELLAVGRHSKMLSIPGKEWVETLSHPRLYPIAMPLAVSALEARHPRIKQWLRAEPTCRRDLFPTLTVAAADDTPSTDATAAASVSTPALRLLGGATPSIYSTSLSPTWANIIGNLHGGAACILGEQIAAASYCSTYRVEVAPPPSMLHVTLLSGLVCDGRSAVLEALTSPSAVGVSTGGGSDPLPSAVSSLATLRHATDRGRAVECAVWW